MRFQCAKNWISNVTRHIDFVDVSIHAQATLRAEDDTARGCVTVVIERDAENEIGMEWLHLVMTPDNARNIAQMLHNTAQICDKLHERYS